jgi:hypothetical protein
MGTKLGDNTPGEHRVPSGLYTPIAEPRGIGEVVAARIDARVAN